MQLNVFCISITSTKCILDFVLLFQSNCEKFLKYYSKMKIVIGNGNTLIHFKSISITKYKLHFQIVFQILLSITFEK